jgi:hypothetical protein
MAVAYECIRGGEQPRIAQENAQGTQALSDCRMIYERPLTRRTPFPRTLALTAVFTRVFPGLGAAADAPAFQARCASCHARASTLARRLDGDSAEARSGALAKFLEMHHCDDAQARTAIVDYLVGLSSQ